MNLPLPRRAYVGLQLVPTLGTLGAAAARPSSGVNGVPTEGSKPALQGLLVRDVAPGSSAEAAGVQALDRVVKIGGRDVLEINDARAALRGLVPGQRLGLEVLRGTLRLHLSTLVRAYPMESHPAARVELGSVPVVAPDASVKHRLRAIALLPQVAPPSARGYPVVYYLPGAHWASEEYPFSLLHPVPALLGELAARGIASVRVERSGLGDSEGAPCTQTDFESELAGYRAGYEWLAAQPWVDPRRMVLFGHSLGAMVAPLLAQQAPAPQGIVTYGASAIPIVEGLIGALERYAALRNTTQPESAAWLDGSKPPAVTTAFVAQQSELLRWVVAGKLTPREALAQLPELKSARPDHFTDDTIYRRNVRFYHQLQTAPLEASWRNCPCPLLALHGARDWVTSLEDSQRLAALVSLGGVVKSDVVQVYADHQMADPNLVKNRVELEAAAIVPELASLRLAPGLCELVSDWIAAL